LLLTPVAGSCVDDLGRLRVPARLREWRRLLATRRPAAIKTAAPARDPHRRFVLDASEVRRRM